MRKYIENLTTDLINRNRYDDLLLKINIEDPKFVKHIQLDLEVGDIAKMNPETLGRIMASFEIGDVMVTRSDIFENVSFSGDCEDFLRQLVALCLAYVIKDRLDPNRIPQTPAYKRRSLSAKKSTKLN